VIPGDANFVANVAAAGALAVIAAATGLTADELGLARWSSGWRVGGAAFAAITVVAIAGVALPATRGFFDDERADIDAAAMLGRVLVLIPVGTVVLDELAFRGVLFALCGAGRESGPRSPAPPHCSASGTSRHSSATRGAR